MVVPADRGSYRLERTELRFKANIGMLTAGEDPTIRAPGQTAIVTNRSAIMSARSLTRDEDRWAAVIRRDPDADRAFYYAVRTTGVYCRPSCAARRARRENVSFHESCEAAECAGFRPCKRCRPNERTGADSNAGAPGGSVRFAVSRCSLGRVL